jgi:cytoskeleton protein RodZ
MSSIGETLRRERLRQSLDLEHISRELKIASRFLEAIETERFDRLPAGVFAKSFVRQYAQLLGLDGDELAGEFQKMMEPPPEPDPHKPNVSPVPDIHVPRVDAWDAVGDRRGFGWTSVLPALVLVVVVMLACAGVYAFWTRATRPPVMAQTGPRPTETVPRPASQQPAPAEPAAQAPASAPTEPPNTPPPAVEQPKATDETAPAASPATPQPQPADAPAPPEVSADRPASEAVSNPNAAVRVHVTADETAWVLARADGKYLFSGTLEPSQSRSVEANEMLTLRLGNAGGVTITLNGKPVGPIGPKGQVREVQFTSGGFQIVAAPKPSFPEERPI